MWRDGWTSQRKINCGNQLSEFMSCNNKLNIKIINNVNHVTYK